MALTAFTAGAAEQTTTSGGPTTSLQTEYIMKMYVPLEAHVVGDSLRIVNHPGGWIEGPRIKGKIVPPSGDWLRTTANGLNRLDVRLTLQTDDGTIVYMSYNGMRVHVVLPGTTATDFWETAGTPVENLPGEIVMPATAVVDAALAGLDQGKFATVPSLPYLADWSAYEAVRQTLMPSNRPRA